MTLSKPISEKNFTASARPTAPPTFGVPASHLATPSAHVHLSYSTFVIIPPPNLTGSRLFNNDFLPQSTPVPIGPYILCPENAYKSIPKSTKSTGKCATAWAPSTTTTTSSLNFLASEISFLIGEITPVTFEQCVTASILSLFLRFFFII